jgi:hypothetical protein
VVRQLITGNGKIDSTPMQNVSSFGEAMCKAVGQGSEKQTTRPDPSNSIVAKEWSSCEANKFTNTEFLLVLLQIHRIV